MMAFAQGNVKSVMYKDFMRCFGFLLLYADKIGKMELMTCAALISARILSHPQFSRANMPPDEPKLNRPGTEVGWCKQKPRQGSRAPNAGACRF